MLRILAWAVEYWAFKAELTVYQQDFQEKNYEQTQQNVENVCTKQGKYNLHS